RPRPGIVPRAAGQVRQGEGRDRLAAVARHSGRRRRPAGDVSDAAGLSGPREPGDPRAGPLEPDAPGAGGPEDPLRPGGGRPGAAAGTGGVEEADPAGDGAATAGASGRAELTSAKGPVSTAFPSRKCTLPGFPPFPLAPPLPPPERA